MLSNKGQPILQAEAAECGLACLATVMAHHGRRERLSDLRRQFPISLTGTSLKSIVSIADSVGFTARAVRCDMDELNQLAVPAILHWGMDHFVVLRRVSGRAVEIADPARGHRRIPIADASRHFTGVALELTPAPDFVKSGPVDRVRLSDLWARVSGLKPILFQLIVLSFILQVLAVIAPLSSQLVIDDVIGRGDRNLLFAIMVGFGSLAIIQVAIETLRGFIQLHMGQRLSMQLSGNLLKHMLRLPIQFFERRHIGDILSRFSSLAPAQTFLTNGLITVLLDALLVIPVAIIMVMYSPLLAGLVLINLVVVFAVRSAAFPTTKRLSEETIHLSAKTQSVFLETIRAVRAIKIAGHEKDRHALWQNALSDQQSATFRSVSFGLWGSSGFGLWAALHGLAMLYFGALQVIDGKLTLGMYFAFQSYSGQFSGRVQGLIGAFFSYRMLGLHLERLADIIHAEPDKKGLAGLAMPSRGFESLKVSNLAFRYGEFDQWVFEKVSFEVHPGETVAIVGPSGGGKSTLLKVLIGIYEAQHGDIVINGVSSRTTGFQAFRDQIGVVMQDDQLLSGTISDNVSFFDPGFDPARVEWACRQAHVHDDIMAMPMGYYSLIGDMGSILSGGQKQRVILARALYRQPKVLFMDEGTANLDAELEVSILQSLAALDITQIVVAHREAVIAMATRVLLVANGGLMDLSPAPSLDDLEPESVSA